MNEDLNKNLSGESENENALNEELEALRDTFQEKYDETVEEVENGPVIQELEEGEPDDEDDADEETEETAPATVKKPKKKKKVGKIIAITVPVLLLLVIIGSLVAYVVASVTNPNFNSFISTYAQASSAETYDDRISYLEQALEYCSDDESVFQQAMKATILEEIVVAMYESEGYSSAYAYMTSEMSEENINNPVSAAFKKFLSAVNDVQKLSLEVFNKVYENIGDATQAPGYEVLSEGLSVPEELRETMEEILNSVAQGYIYNKTADGIDDSVVAMNYYANAYSGLVSVGADERELAEKIAVDLYNKGFVIEAAALASVAIDPEKENVNADYEKVAESIKAVGETGVNVLETAKKAMADEKTSAEDILALVKETEGITEENAKIIASFAEYAVKALGAEEEKNLTEAASCYATLTSVLEAFSMADTSIHLKTAQIIFDSGNLSDSNTLITNYLSEEAMKDASVEEKAVYEKMTAVFAALESTSEVFSPYYSEYYQTGAAMDYDEIKTAFDEAFGEDATDYEKGFIYYCLYFAAASSENDDKINETLTGMKDHLSDLPLVYLYYYVDNYLSNDKLADAKAYAEKILEVNIADGFANGVVAMAKRAGGDIDGAIDTALKGIELAGSSPDCAQQLAIAYLLKGDMESAYGYITSVYNESQSVDAFDLVLIFNALYEGDDAEIKAELETLVSTVNQTYSYYGITSHEDTTAIIEGTKTLEEVFMNGDYKLS